MKTTRITSLAICLFLALVFTNAQDLSVSKAYELERAAFAKKFNFRESANSNNYDILYHRIFWKIDPAVRYISGEVTSLVKAIKDNVNTLEFDLHTEMTVDSVTYKGSKLTFTHANDIISINLSATLNTGDFDSLSVFYRGVPTTSGFGSFETSTHSGTPIMWTLSEPYGAMEWWPCKQSLLDKVDSIDIYIETAPEYKAASNGKLISEITNNGKKVAYWKHRYPIATYLVAVAVTNYEAYSHYAKLSPTDSVEILNYVYPENLATAKTQTAYTVGVVEKLSELFIDYPFKTEKYGHAQFGWGGGMEHQTMSFMGGFSSDLITHELAHQWFGDHVTCSSWEDIWVNEGFAVFCEGLIQEHLHPTNYINWLINEFQRVLDYQRTGSVWVEDTTSVNRIFNYNLTYVKGGAILHMIRNQIGDEAFFAGINNMLTNQATSGKFASAMDVKNYLETAADTTLDWFFDTWYYGQGYPRYTIDLEYSNADSTKITISQTTTHSSVEFYPMNVPIMLIGNGETTTKWVQNTENNQSFIIKPGFKVNSMFFDPEYKILAPHPATINYSTTKEISKQEAIKVSPNPFTEFLQIKSLDNSLIRQVEIIDMSGKCLYNKKFNASKHINLPVFHLNLPAGKYFTRIYTDNKTYVKPVVKK